MYNFCSPAPSDVETVSLESLPLITLPITQKKKSENPKQDLSQVCDYLSLSVGIGGALLLFLNKATNCQRFSLSNTFKSYAL